MAFERKAVKFSLKDIGSKVIDQISSDIYSGPGSILRELVKNAYDAYLGIPDDDFEDEQLTREIAISREREKGVGHLLIADSGVGMTTEELKGMVQISISLKPEEFENATGFRGLGSWASLGAGSKIVVSSTKKGVGKQSRLTIDIRKIYSKMGPETTLDDILNDQKCIYFEEQKYSKDTHGTTVEIICDGEPTQVNGYELNRLHPYTDPANENLRQLLVAHCPIPFASEGGIYDQIQQIYKEVGYVPTLISLDGELLERRLPAELTAFIVDDLHIAGKLAAKLWYAENPKESREITQINESKHLLDGPGIQLKRLNVPIGDKNKFHAVRANILNWFVGEVHIVMKDVLPNASGQDLRAGSARDVFIHELEALYKKLEERAEAKSIRLSMERKLKQGIEAAKKLAQGNLSTTEKATAGVAVANAVQVIEKTSSIGKPKTVGETRLKEAAKDPGVSKIRTEARKIFKEHNFLTEYSSAKKKPKTKKASAPNTEPATKVPRVIELDDLQAKLGQAVPRFSSIGLSSKQIDEILRIITEVLATD